MAYQKYANKVGMIYEAPSLHLFTLECNCSKKDAGMGLGVFVTVSLDTVLHVVSPPSPTLGMYRLSDSKINVVA